MTKYIKLDDVITIFNSRIKIEEIEQLSTIAIPEPYKGTNYELLQEYIDKSADNHYSVWFTGVLMEIQSRLVNDMPKIGENYEYSNDGNDWDTWEFVGYRWHYDNWVQAWDLTAKQIRVTPSVPPEISSAIKLLEDSGIYTITKK